MTGLVILNGSELHTRIYLGDFGASASSVR